jgi:hypothetical protein
VDDNFLGEYTAYVIKNNLFDKFTLEVVHLSEARRPNEFTTEVKLDKHDADLLLKSIVIAKDFLLARWAGSL